MRLLEHMGHKISADAAIDAMPGEVRSAEQYWGDAECIAIEQKTGERLGASDGRNGGKAVGF